MVKVNNFTISEKTCKDCKKSLPVSEYNFSSRDGYRANCIPCRRVEALLYKSKYHEKIKKRDLARKDYSSMRYKAQQESIKAIRRGDIIKLPCEICGDDKSVGHHDDYTKPLELRFLCKKHHMQWHIENGEGKNP